MKKFAIIYGQMNNDIQKRAVEELTSMLLDYTMEYPICCPYEKDRDMTDLKCIYIGTKQNNPYILKTSQKTLCKDEEYYIKVENGIAVIEGFDDAGVLYGVLDFYNKYIIRFEHPNNDRYWINFLEKDILPDFELCSAPSVKERGLWTWGHVIYDYRDYIHNMMKLKMNSVIIWNDFVPVNAEDIVAYAHSCNIKVIWGFAWLWDTVCDKIDIKSLDLEHCSNEIIEKYEAEYAKVGGDGIYFQTFTEVNGDNIDGVMIADVAARFVNKTAAMFYEKYPDMDIRFGLHATSVRNKLDFIKTVDPRINIVWENCGAFPFAYVPNNMQTFDDTKDFVKKISVLRGEDDRFGVVTKGLVKLDWSQFEHLKGSHCLGVSSEYVKRNRVERKEKIWRYIQSCWLTNADKVYEMVKEMYHSKNGDLCLFALVEDGMFEENIMYPVALYSEMLWDCNADIATLVGEVSMRNYVIFA